MDFLKTNGRSGSITVMWDDLRHFVKNVIERIFSISANVFFPDGTSWWLTVVYGPVKRRN